MTQRLSEFFSQEASEYLGQLEELLAHPGRPDLERLLNLTRGVRGSAQVAGAETIAGVAGRLEDAVRSVLSNHIVWSEEIRRLAAQTVRDLQVLVRAVNRWGPEEEARVRGAIDRWNDVESAQHSPGAVVPIESLFPDDAGPHVVTQPPQADGAGTVVPIESLLLRGGAALQKALQLQGELERELRSRGVLDPTLEEALSELHELMNLAMPVE